MACGEGSLDDGLEGEHELAEGSREWKILVFVGDAQQSDSLGGSKSADDFLHALIRGRRPGRHADDRPSLDPRGVDVVRAVDPECFYALLAGHAYQGLRVGRVLGSHDQDDVGEGRQAAHRRLPVGGGVAEVAAAGSVQVGIPAPCVFEDGFPLEHAERRLGEECHPVGGGGGEGAEPFGGIYERDRLGGFGDGPDGFVVADVADVDDVVAPIGHELHLVMDLGDEGTDSVDHDRGVVCGIGDDLGRRSVGGEHHRAAGRDLRDAVDEHHAGTLERRHHGGVVHDLVVAVDGRREDPHHPGEGLDRHLDAGAEAAGLGQQDRLHHRRDGRRRRA